MVRFTWQLSKGLGEGLNMDIFWSEGWNKQVVEIKPSDLVALTSLFSKVLKPPELIFKKKWQNMLEERSGLTRRITVLESGIGKNHSVWGMEKQKHNKKKFCVLEVIKKRNRMTRDKRQVLGADFHPNSEAGDYPKGRWWIIVHKGYFWGWR